MLDSHWTMCYTVAWVRKGVHEKMSQSNTSNGETTTPKSFQPMGFTDIIDTMFSYYREHFRLLVGISAIYAFWQMFYRFVFLSSTHWLIDWFGLVVDALFYAWLVCASMQIYLGRHTTPGAAFRQVERRFWSYLGSSLIWLLVVMAAIVIGSLFGALANSSSPYDAILGLIIGLPCGIYFGTRWGFHAQAVLVEEVSATNALRRSRELVTGTWWRIFGILSAIVLLVLVIELILVTSLMFIFVLSGVAGEVDFSEIIRQILQIVGSNSDEGNNLSFVIIAVIDIFTTPILPIGVTLLYFDQRIRKEAFDIEMMVAKEAM